MDRQQIILSLRERILGLATLRLGRDMAEDLAQEVLMVQRYGPTGDPRSWSFSEACFSDPVTKVTGNNTKFEKQVSQND
jgi:hypothetical protein